MFDEIGAGPERAVTIDAQWVMLAGGTQQLVRRERIDVPLSSLDSSEIARGYGEAIGQLADRIVTQLSGR